MNLGKGIPPTASIDLNGMWGGRWRKMAHEYADDFIIYKTTVSSKDCPQRKGIKEYGRWAGRSKKAQPDDYGVKKRDTDHSFTQDTKPLKEQVGRTGKKQKTLR